MPKANGAKVTIHPDGTFVFDAAAVRAFRLRQANCISVFYSRPAARFILQPLRANAGVPLEKSHAGAMVARQAADFLNEIGVLPATSRKYNGQYYADLKMIVVRGVTASNRRKHHGRTSR